MPSKNKDIDGVDEKIEKVEKSKQTEKVDAQTSEKIKTLLNEAKKNGKITYEDSIDLLNLHK